MSTASEHENSTSKRSKRLSGNKDTSSVLFPSDRCIFCNKEFVEIKGEKQSLTKCRTKTAEQSIKEAAERRNDEALLHTVSDVDLLAREAHYHNSCRWAYTRNENRHSLNSDSDVAIMLEAHRKSFEQLCGYIEEHIVSDLKLERMTMLLERYPLYLFENNKKYATRTTKQKSSKKKLRSTLEIGFSFGDPQVVGNWCTRLISLQGKLWKQLLN